jgi:ABC-type Zn uptake system ZnuABC Zn-binding protein ZnuA
LNIVTTTSDIASLVKEIGGEHVTVHSLNSGTRDPHFLQAKPSYISLARQADCWIRVGMELEIGYEPVILDACRNPRIRPGGTGHLDLSETIMRLEVPTARIDRSMGDVHPAGNPHYWIDPYNGRQMALAIRDKLKALDPSHALDYSSSCEAFLARLDAAMFGVDLVRAYGGEALWKATQENVLGPFLKEHPSGGRTLEPGGWIALASSIKGQKIVVYHRSWIYLSQRFGFKEAAELEPKPGIPPGPGHLQQVIQTMREQNVKVVLIEPFYDATSARFAAEKTGAQVVVAANTVGGQPEARDYISMLDHVLTLLKDAFNKGRTP